MLYEDTTILWRCALPRAGWWRTAPRARLPLRPLSQSQITREEALKRQPWLRDRSWSPITSGVRLSVLGAVPYGTSQVFSKVVPHFDAQELRQYLHQGMATFRKTGTVANLPLFYQRTRQVLMAQQERPISAFHW